MQMAPTVSWPKSTSFREDSCSSTSLCIWSKYVSWELANKEPISLPRLNQGKWGNLRSIISSAFTSVCPRDFAHSFAPSPVSNLYMHVRYYNCIDYYFERSYIGGILPSDSNPLSPSTTIWCAVIIGFLMPLTAPTAPKVPLSPVIKLASHSTVPFRVKLDPYPAFVTGSFLFIELTVSVWFN